MSEIAADFTIVSVRTRSPKLGTQETAPSIKIATNTEMCAKIVEDMDYDAGRIVSEGLTIERAGREIYDLLPRVASGAASKSEARGLGDYEFVPWQIGATM